jgi:hypothetical protein
MKKEIHSSSGSNEMESTGFNLPSEESAVVYKDRDAVSSFHAGTISVSSSFTASNVTFKVARGLIAMSKDFTSFPVNITQNALEENIFRINKELSGEALDTPSTKND